MVLLHRIIRVARRSDGASRGAHQRGQPMVKWVYSFGDGEAEGKAEMRNLLGGKGANLAEMSNLGLPVPPGFTITTEVCTWFYANGQTYPAGLEDELRAALRQSRSAAPRLGPLRRPRLDARDDGHRPQSRPQRPDRGIARPLGRRSSL